MIHRDIKEGFIVSGSGTVLDQIDEEGFEDNRVRTSSLRDAASREYLTSDDVVLEDLSLGVIDSRTKIEAFKVLHVEGEMTDEEYVRKVADELGFNEEQYNKFARVNINMEIKMNDAGLGGKTSVISRLDLSMLDSMTVKDLPEKIRVNLLSILRLQRQRKRRQKQALGNKKKATARHAADAVEGDTEEGTYDEDTGNSNRRNSTVKTNRKRRDSQGKEGKLHGSRGSMEDVSDQETRKFRGLFIAIISHSSQSNLIFPGIGPVNLTLRNNSSPMHKRPSSTSFPIWPRARGLSSPVYRLLSEI